MGSKMKYRLVSLLVLIVLLMSEVHSQCTCELVDPYPRFLPGQTIWLGMESKPLIICIEHYYGDYKVVVRYRTYVDVDVYVEEVVEYVNPYVYTGGCFWFITPPHEYVTVDLVMLSEGEVFLYWDFCVLCCPSTTTITTTETTTQFIHDNRVWIIMVVIVLILLWLIKR
jgi:hypothetical protein